MKLVSCLALAAIGLPVSAAFAQDAAAPAPAPAAPLTTTAEDWRPLDPQNTLVLQIQKRVAPGAPAPAGGAVQTVLIELAPELAPNHVARIKALARQGFYDGRTFHRVLDGFMAQAGGIPGDDTGGESPLPDLQSEFAARLGPEVTPARVQDMRRVNPRDMGSPVTEAGFWNGFPVGYQPTAQTMVSADGKRDVWMLHCKGTAASARTSDPNSANFQFYITRGKAPWLDASYTAWGRVRAGQEAVDALKIGEPVVAPDTILSLDVAADLPPADRPQIEVMNTDGAAFAALLTEARAAAAASGYPIDVCDVEVPTRAAE